MGELSKKAVGILQTYAGHYFAETYGEFYQDQSDEVIRESMLEVLTDLVGERKAKEIIEKELAPTQ